MQYDSKIEEELIVHNDIQNIDDIEIIELINGNTFLYNTKTKKILINEGKYEILIDKRNKYIYIKDTNNKISIYDIEKRKMVIKDWIIDKKISFDINNKSDIMFILKNPEDNGMHIFNSYAIRQGDDILNKSFKDIKFIRKYPNHLFIVTQEKQGVYSYNENNKKKLKLEEPIEYDRIDAYEHLLIFTKGNQQIAKKTNDLNNKTDYYETIEIEKKESYKGRYIKCRKNKTIDIIHTGRLKKIISSDKFDDINIDHIKKIRSGVYDFFFNVKKDNQQGIVKTRNILYQNENTTPKIEEIVKVEYDKVYFNEDDYIIIKNNNKGLSIGDIRNNKPIEPEYDIINQIGIYSYLFAKDKEASFKSIISRSNYPKIASLVEKCKIINYDESNNSYIFEKNNQLGIFFPSINHCVDDGIIQAKYDDIIKYINNFYLLIKNNFKTLSEKEKIIITKEYEDIKIGIEEDCYDINRKDKLYFALKENGLYKLAKRDKRDQPIEIMNNNEYKEVDFIANLIICKDEYCTFIYNYEDKLVAKLPPNTTIEHQKDVNKTSYLPVFKINENYYYYKDGKLYIPYLETRDKYWVKLNISGQEYIITTYNEEEYKKLIEYIKRQSDEVIEQLLEEYFNSNEAKEYPNIKIKKLT